MKTFLLATFIAAAMASRVPMETDFPSYEDEPVKQCTAINLLRAFIMAL